MKKFVSMALALTVAASMAVPAFAASEPVAPQNEPTAATESVSPCIYWTGTAKLNTTFDFWYKRNLPTAISKITEMRLSQFH